VHSLLQWFDKVINETILKDLDKAIGNVRVEEGEMPFLFID